MREGQKRDFARKLRREQTETETKMWWLLRSRRFSEYKFVRQVTIDGYVVDFCCKQKGLVVELDGGQHCERKAYDDARTRKLESLGYHVVRYWDHQVFKETDDVLQDIWNHLERLPDRFQALTRPSARPLP